MNVNSSHSVAVHLLEDSNNNRATGPVLNMLYQSLSPIELTRSFLEDNFENSDTEVTIILLSLLDEFRKENDLDCLATRLKPPRERPVKSCL